jgi:hypothetical protein
MNLKPLGANKTELTLEKDGQRIRVLFSYETPVACDILTSEGMEYYRTEEFYSKTTSKHINSWMPMDQAEEKPQSFFDDLVK